MTVCVVVAAGLLAAGRRNLWAGRAASAQYDLFVRRRTACRSPQIGATHMNAEPRGKTVPRGSGVHKLSASNTRDMF